MGVGAYILLGSKTAHKRHIVFYGFKKNIVIARVGEGVKNDRLAIGGTFLGCECT